MVFILFVSWSQAPSHEIRAGAAQGDPGGWQLCPCRLQLSASVAAFSNLTVPLLLLH